MPLPIDRVRALVRRYLSRFEILGWNRFEGFDWSLIDGSLLTDEQLDAVKTAFLVEDHIPGYSRNYNELFALEPGLAFGLIELALKRYTETRSASSASGLKDLLTALGQRSDRQRRPVAMIPSLPPSR